MITVQYLLIRQEITVILSLISTVLLQYLLLDGMMIKKILFIINVLSDVVNLELWNHFYAALIVFMHNNCSCISNKKVLSEFRN